MLQHLVGHITEVGPGWHTPFSDYLLFFVHNRRLVTSIDFQGCSYRSDFRLFFFGFNLMGDFNDVLYDGLLDLYLNYLHRLGNRLDLDRSNILYDQNRSLFRLFNQFNCWLPDGGR